MSTITLNREASSAAGVRAERRALPWSSASTYLCLILLGAVPYLNTLLNGFVYDDGFQVLKNSYLHSFKYLHQIFFTLAWSFQGTQGMTNYYRPLMTFEYLILYQLFGPIAYSYHLANVIMNVLVVCAVFVVTSRLFGSFLFALLTAALFAVHPIHTEVVSWVAGVSDMQWGLAVLLAFGCFLHISSATGRRWWVLQAGMGGGFLLALLSKEPAAMLPVVATTFEHFYREDRRLSSWKAKLSRYGIFWALLGGYLVFRTHFLGAVVPIFQRPRLTWYQVFLTAITLLGQYLGKLVWPLHMSLFYPFHESSKLNDPEVLLGAAALAACGVLFVILWKRAHLVSFGMIWFFAFMAPVLNSRWMAANVFAERYLYVPSIGFCWIVVWAGLHWWQSWRDRPRAYRIALVSAGCLILFAGVVRIVVRNLDWKTDLTLYSSSLRLFPKADLIRANLGAAKWNNGDFEGAEREWHEALRISPENVVAMGDLALARKEQKRYSEAIELLHQALRLRPRYAAAHMTLGDVYAEIGDTAQAEAELRKAIELYPLNPDSRNNLAELLLKQGRIGDAEEQYLASVNSIPNFKGYDGLGSIYFDRGQRDKAETSYRDAILDYPFDHEAHFRLGLICAESGRIAEAIREYEAGLETDPNNSQAQAALRKLKAVGSPSVSGK